MNKVRLLIRYIKDKEVSVFKKLLILGSLLYIVFPFDIVPDFIIGLGLIDDAAVILFVWKALKYELIEYEKNIRSNDMDQSKVIEVNFEKNDDEGD